MYAKKLVLAVATLAMSACISPTRAIVKVATAPMPTAEPYQSVTQVQGGTTSTTKTQSAIAADLRLEAIKQLGGIGKKEAETKGLQYPYGMYGTGLPQAAPGHFRGYQEPRCAPGSC